MFLVKPVHSISFLRAHNFENQVLREPEKRRIYADSADEWFGMLRDIGRDNVLLTLDTSHAATSAAARDTAAERVETLYAFLD